MTKKELLEIQDKILNPLAILQGVLEAEDEFEPEKRRKMQQSAIDRIAQYVNSLRNKEE